MIKFGIGQAVTRKEDDRFLRGTGRNVSWEGGVVFALALAVTLGLRARK